MVGLTSVAVVVSQGSMTIPITIRTSHRLVRSRQTGIFFGALLSGCLVASGIAACGDDGGDASATDAGVAGSAGASARGGSSGGGSGIGGGGGTEVDLSAIGGITIWGASENAVIFVGDLDSTRQNGVARDPDDPFDDGVAEIDLPSSIAQSDPGSNQHTVVAVEGAAWAILRDRDALVRADRADLLATTVAMDAELKAIAGDDEALYAAATTPDLSSPENIILELDPTSGAERARVSVGYESNQGGPLQLIVHDDEYVVASRQNAPSEIYVASRTDIAMGASHGPFDDLIRGIAIDDGRIYVTTSGDLVSDPHTVTVLDAATGDAVDQFEISSQRILIVDGLFAIGSGRTQSSARSYVGVVGAFDSPVALETSASVTDLAKVGDLGLLLLANGTLIFETSTLAVLFESDLFGRVGDIYLP